MEKTPENLYDVYETVRGILERSMATLETMEEKFYGSNQTANLEIKEHLPYIKELAMQTEVNHVNSLNHIDRIQYLVENDYQTDSFRKQRLSKLKDYQTKIEKYIPRMFVQILTDLKSALEIMDQYCSSFYDLVNDVYLGTARDYEVKRQNSITDTNKLLDNIPILSKKYRTTGLDAECFGTYTKALGLMYECTPFSILLMFPEACSNVRASCDLIREWILEDKNFVKYMRSEVGVLRDYQQELFRNYVEQTGEIYQLNYKIRQLKDEREQLEKDTAALREKKNVLTGNEEKLSLEIRDLVLSTDAKQMAKNELDQKKASQGSLEGIELSMYEGLISDIKSLNESQRDVEKDLRHVKLNLNYLKKKTGQAEFNLDEIKQMEEKVVQLEESSRKLMAEQKIVSEQFELAKSIHLYKISPHTLEKIYLGMPTRGATKRYGSVQVTTPSQIDTACAMITNRIGAEWPDLYRSLPFFPPRGDEVLAEDIHQLKYRNYRVSEHEQAARAIERWRRHHTRVRLDDLKQALLAINKEHVWRKIDRKLFPPAREKTDDSNKDLPEVPEHLLPYYQQVERFDELKGYFEKQAKEEQRLLDEFVANVSGEIEQRLEAVK